MSEMQGHHWSSQKALEHGVSERIKFVELDEKQQRLLQDTMLRIFEPNSG